MLRCFVFNVEQCQQSELIPSGANQATLRRDFQVLVVSASTFLPATEVGVELDKIRRFENFVEVCCGEVKANRLIRNKNNLPTSRFLKFWL